MTNRENNLTQRESFLEKGTIFDEYQYFMDFRPSGRMKMIVLSQLEGYLHIHTCSNCSKIYAPPSIAKLAHFKNHIDNGSFTYSNYLSMYSESLKKEMQYISSFRSN